MDELILYIDGIININYECLSAVNVILSTFFFCSNTILQTHTVSDATLGRLQSEAAARVKLRI